MLLQTSSLLQPDLTIIYRRLAALVPDARNARRHSPDQIRALARSIEAVGFNVPVLVDSNLKILSGHGRVLAAKELGLAEVPTISLEHLSEAQGLGRVHCSALRASSPISPHIQ
jgi:ParB-like chromosome segregation protein Spo0J